MVRGRHVEQLITVVYTVLCGVWLTMFLKPMSELGLLTGATSFVLPIGVLVVSLWFPWWWIRAIGAILASFGYVVVYWRPAHVAFVPGVKLAFRHLGSSTIMLLQHHQFIDPIQTFLFVWLIIGVLWLVTYASRRTRLWIFYNILAISVFAAIDSNTNVHPNLGLVVIIIIGAGILGLNQLARIQLFLPVQEPVLRRYITPLAVFVVFAVIIALALPKQSAVWANPFGPSSEGNGKGQQTIGYQLNDTKLGGSFVENDDPAVMVYSSEPTYLRGQTLSDYTGKGWVSAPVTGANTVKEHLGQAFTNTGNSDFNNTLPSKTITQTIHIMSQSLNTRDLLGGYAIDQVLRLPRLDNSGVLTLDTLQGNLHGPQLKQGDVYDIKVKSLRDPYTILSKDTTDYATTKGDIPSVIHTVDLELPSSLPRRVGNLAQKIVNSAGAKSEYQMVDALITYLHVNYNYQTYDIPVPKGRQDYVDQFLFDSKVGYCNNFSSSLAVMLRTLGVPTRWVTGFASGTEDYSYTGQQNRYIITNNDAHSWVEVYFPQYGWVPFDPTPSFSIPFAAAANVGSDSSSTTPATPPKQPTKPVTPPKAPQPPQSSASGGGGSSIAWGPILRIISYALIGCIVLALFFWWLLRNRVALYRLQRKWQRQPAAALARSYMLVFRAIRKRFGLERSVTLRELWPYAAEVGIGRTEYRNWVSAAERLLYNGESLDGRTLEGMQRTSLRWLRLLYQSEKRQKSSFDDK